MEPKDLEDLYRVGDSNPLRQMSIDNANAAIQQAKMNFDKALEDYQMDLLSRRINGGSPNLLGRLKIILPNSYWACHAFVFLASVISHLLSS